MDSSSILHNCTAVIVTYAMHSTLFLVSIWLIGKTRIVSSHVVTERLWKWATIAPLLTTAVQLSWSDSASVWEWRFDSDAVVSAEKTENELMRSSSRFVDHQIAATASSAPAIRLAVVDKKTLHADTEPSNDMVEALLLPVNIDNTRVNVQMDDERGADPVAGAGDSWEISIVPGFPQGTKAVATHPVDPEPRTSAGVVEVSDVSGPHVETILPTAASPASPTAATVVTQKWNLTGSRWPAFFVVVLVAGFLALGVVRLLIHQCRIRICIGASSESSSGPTARALQQICGQRNIVRRIRLLTSRKVSEPSACGVFRWAIVLPEDLVKNLNHDELNALLAHEVGHLIRRDTLWLWIGRVFTYCIPWQPLHFVAVRRWQQAAEFQCDEWALKGNVDGLTLAKVLTRVAEWKTNGSLTPGLPASAPPLSLRIEWLLKSERRTDGWSSGWRHRSLLISLLIVFLAMSAFGPRIMWGAVGSVIPERATPEIDEPFAETQSASQSETLLQRDIDALTKDLKLAMRLLSEAENDAVITAKAESIVERVGQLRRNSQRLFTEKSAGQTLNSAEISFMDVTDYGHSVVFLVDVSASMAHKNRLEQAKRALLMSLRQLDETQRFQVLFSNETVSHLHLRQRAKEDTYAATTVNVQLAVQEINSIQVSGATSHFGALQAAINLSPDVIYFVTDSDDPNLSRKELNRLRPRTSDGPRIHVAIFGGGSETSDKESSLQTLSRFSGGETRFIPGG